MHFRQFFDTHENLASDFKGKPFSILILISLEKTICKIFLILILLLLANYDFYYNNKISQIKDLRIDDFEEFYVDGGNETS